MYRFIYVTEIDGDKKTSYEGIANIQFRCDERLDRSEERKE